MGWINQRTCQRGRIRGECIAQTWSSAVCEDKCAAVPDGTKVPWRNLPSQKVSFQLTMPWLKMSDSYNHVFGQCVNPLNRALISGGSSGGEGSIVSARGSILGIGTDIGGSIRIPAALCGLYSLMPGSGRHPYERKG